MEMPEREKISLPKRSENGIACSEANVLYEKFIKANSMEEALQSIGVVDHLKEEKHSPDCFSQDPDKVINVIKAAERFLQDLPTSYRDII